MKPVKSKKQQREELDRQMRDYLSRGGQVNEVPPGATGRGENNQPLPHVFDKKAEPQTRTPVDEVVAAIERRRKTPRPPLRDKRRNAKPREPQKRIIYDEFGEPLRWEWDDS